MNYQAAQFWMNVIVFFISAGVWVYAWRVKRDMATNEKITEIEAAISLHVQENSVQLAHLDGRLKQAIRHDDLKELYTRMGGIEKGLSRLEGRFESVDHLNQSIQEIGLRSK